MLTLMLIIHFKTFSFSVLEIFSSGEGHILWNSLFIILSSLFLTYFSIPWKVDVMEKMQGFFCLVELLSLVSTPLDTCFLSLFLHGILFWYPWLSIGGTRSSLLNPSDASSPAPAFPVVHISVGRFFFFCIFRSFFEEGGSYF